MLGVLLIEICLLVVLVNHVIAFPLPLLVRRIYASSYDFIPVVAAGESYPLPPQLGLTPIVGGGLLQGG